MTRKYQNADLQRMYDACIVAFGDARSEFYFQSGALEGKPRKGAGHRCAFWHGFDGNTHFLRSPGTLNWAAYMAGKDCAR